jgi:hypothetical protein
MLKAVVAGRRGVAGLLGEENAWQHLHGSDAWWSRWA